MHLFGTDFKQTSSLVLKCFYSEEEHSYAHQQCMLVSKKKRKEKKEVFGETGRTKQHRTYRQGLEPFLMKFGFSHPGKTKAEFSVTVRLVIPSVFVCVGRG